MTNARVLGAHATEGAPFEAVSVPVRIYQIAVKSLFGYLDYSLPNDPEKYCDSEVLILYGENGSGKTTILELAFHLLSPDPFRGHWNAIARIPFKTFQIVLTDGTTFQASRPADRLTGECEVVVQHKGESAAWVVDLDLDPKLISKGPFPYAFERLKTAVYLLSADRNIRSDIWPQHSLDTMPTRNRRRIVHVADQERPRKTREDAALAFALSQAHEWVRRQAVRSNNLGVGNANTIYADIIKRITKFGPEDGPAEGDRFSDITSHLDRLSSQAADLARFRFTPPLNVDEIRGALRFKHPAQVGAVGAVLEAFVDTTEARFKALDNIYRLTSTFINSLNGFYSGSGKAVTYDVVDGLKVTSPIGQALEPAWLSSGEKHLLTLFSHVLTARDKPSVFIIDEPELSLNVKWQRRLIGSLLDVASGAPVQFVFATHSLEFLSQHFDRVIELTPTDPRPVQTRGTQENIGVDCPIQASSEP